MSNLTKNKKAGLTGKKIAIIATAVVLLAAIIVGIVLSNIERGFRYDKEDLTPYYVLGDLDADLIKSLGIEVETDVTQAGILDKIESKLIEYFNSDKLSFDNGSVLEDGTIHYVNLSTKDGDDTVDNFGDIVWIYYDIQHIQEKDDAGNALTTPKMNAVMSNMKLGVLPTGTSLKNATETSATKVRLGSGDLNLVIEKLLNNHAGETGSSIDRWTDSSHTISAGENLVLKVKMTYTDDAGATKKILDLSNFAYYYDDGTLAENASDGKYKGATDFGFPSDLSADAKAELAATIKEWLDDGRKVTDKTTGKVSLNLKATDGKETEVSYEIEITSAFEAKYKLFDSIELTEDLTYKDASGTSKTLKGKTSQTPGDKIRIELYVEKVISLKNTATYDALAAADADYKTFRDAWKATLAADATVTAEQECAKYIEYTKDVMIKEYVAEQIDRGEDETDEEYASRIETLHAQVASALWLRLVKDYTDTVIDDGKQVIAFPEEEIDRYYDAIWESYRAEYYSAAEANKKEYPNGVAEYILEKRYADEVDATTGFDTMDATAMRELAEKYIKEEAREEIGAKLLLFSLANAMGLELDRSDLKTAKEELYAVAYSQNAYYQSIFYSTSYGAAPTKPTAPKEPASTATEEEKAAYQAAYAEYLELSEAYTAEKAEYDERKAARIAHMADEAADEYVDNLTKAYIREYAMLSKMHKTLVPTDAEALLSYVKNNVTWVMAGETTAED